MIRWIGVAVSGFMLAGMAGASLAQTANEPEVVASDPTAVEAAAEIGDFRVVVESSEFIPLPESLSLESLLGSYSLALAASKPCGMAICIGGEVMSANLSLHPEVTHFAGLSFSSDPVEADDSREADRLVLVIDRSGSMEGWKLTQVKQALEQALASMPDGSRIGIVSFGAAAQTEVTVSELGASREKIEDLIDDLKAGGETDMEAGLAMGFELARTGGASRVILLSDEVPNIYGGRPDGFMAMADAAQANGISLSVVGVGHRYDNTTALQLSSLMGGRFHEMTPREDTIDLLVGAWPALVGGGPSGGSVIVEPANGYRISSIYGVPAGMVARLEDGAVRLDLGAAYLMERGSGVYLGLAATGEQQAVQSEALATVQLQLDPNGEQRIQIALTQASATASHGLAGAQQLVEEYLVLKAALQAWHGEGDTLRAIELAAFLNAKMARSEFAFMERERAIVAKLGRRMATSEPPLPPQELVGRWEVLSVDGLSGTHKGDIVQMTADGAFIIFQSRGRDAGITTRQTFQHRADQILIDNTDLVFDYKLGDKGRKLELTATIGDERLKLRRAD